MKKIKTGYLKYSFSKRWFCFILSYVICSYFKNSLASPRFHEKYPLFRKWTTCFRFSQLFQFSASKMLTCGVSSYLALLLIACCLLISLSSSFVLQELPLERFERRYTYLWCHVLYVSINIFRDEIFDRLTRSRAYPFIGHRWGRLPLDR